MSYDNVFWCPGHVLFQSLTERFNLFVSVRSCWRIHLYDCDVLGFQSDLKDVILLLMGAQLFTHSAIAFCTMNATPCICFSFF